MPKVAHVIDGVVQSVLPGVPSDYPVLDAIGQVHACDDAVTAQWVRVGDAFVDPISLRPEPTQREKRRAAYFEALKVEPGDDQITVLGDQVDKLLAQLAAIVPVNARTPEFADLLSKVLDVKTRVPKFR